MRYNYDYDTKSYLIDEYEFGRTSKDLAEEMNISVDAMRRLLRYWGARKNECGQGISYKVVQLDKNRQLINEFNSCKQAELKTNVANTHISACCIGKEKSAGGYIWMRSSDYFKTLQTR